MERIGQADRLADLALQKSATDARALFVKTLTLGLRADYVALVDGQGLKALSYTKAGRVYANRLLAVDRQAFDAYLGPGVENYLLSLKPVAARLFIRLTGSETDFALRIQQDASAGPIGGHAELAVGIFRKPPRIDKFWIHIRS